MDFAFHIFNYSNNKKNRLFVIAISIKDCPNHRNEAAMFNCFCTCSSTIKISVFNLLRASYAVCHLCKEFWWAVYVKRPPSDSTISSAKPTRACTYTHTHTHYDSMQIIQYLLMIKTIPFSPRCTPAPLKVNNTYIPWRLIGGNLYSTPSSWCLFLYQQFSLSHFCPFT